MRLLARAFPHPYLTVLLTLVWLLLVNRFSVNSLLFGFFLGLVIPRITSVYWPNRPTLSRPALIVQYVLIVLWDIVVANVVVAWLILFRRTRDLQPRWIAVPLELRKPEAITVLAGTITLSPGTLSADMSAEGHYLLVHCLHAPDPDAVRDEIKKRYERRLLEIFE